MDSSSGSRSVDFYFGCTGLLAGAGRTRMKQLTNSIDEQLDTQRWIGTPTSPGAVEHAER